MTLRDYGASLVRTIVPWLVGAVLAFLAVHGLHLALPAGATSALAGAAAVAYYAAVRAAEHRWPKVGWLLGFATAPNYLDPSKHVVLPTVPGDPSQVQVGPGVTATRPAGGGSSPPSAV